MDTQPLTVSPLNSRVTPMKRGKIFWAFADSKVLITRSILHILKNIDQLMSVAFQPIMFMLLFRYVFGGAIQTEGTTYVNFLFAGILVQMGAFGSSYTSIGVATDLQRGIIDRFRSLPMISSAVLVGHTTADLVRNMISGVIMVLVGLLVGFRPNASVQDWFLVFIIFMLFTYAFSWLSAILGLLAKSIEAVQWISFVFIFPLTFASSAFVQTDGMPKYLRLFAENQPVTIVINTIRALLNGWPLGSLYVQAVAWCVGTLLVCIPLSAYLFRRRANQ